MQMENVFSYLLYLVYSYVMYLVVDKHYIGLDIMHALKLCVCFQNDYLVNVVYESVSHRRIVTWHWWNGLI